MNRRFIGLLALLPLTGCAGRFIQSPLLDDELRLRDSDDNRAIVDLVASYEASLEALDLNRIGEHVSEEYYENAGTTDTTEDDYGYESLMGQFAVLTEHVREMRVDIEVHSITVDGDRADVLFDYSFTMLYSVDGLDRWETDRDVNRLQLIRENESWRIAGGL
jgi:hypothetical protein